MLSTNQQAFLALARAGLWEKDVQIASFGKVDYTEVYRLAQEQSIPGLVAAGLEHVIDVIIPQELALQFVGSALQLEQRNLAMNSFVSSLIERMLKADIYTILVKGQGIAQCYERPLWRSSGDIDLLLNDDNYKKAIDFLTPMADEIVDNTIETKHYALSFKMWEVELHGTLYSQLSKRIDDIIDILQNNTFKNREVRVWRNGNTDVNLPSPNNDVVFLFTHILQHFFHGGIGLRQLCDLSRFLWVYRECIDRVVLHKRLTSMGVMTEWRAFGRVFVDYLGLPLEAFPFYDKACYGNAGRIISYILEVGNFGHKKDIRYQSNYPSIIRKLITFGRQAKDSLKLSLIFPVDAPVFLLNYLIRGVKQL